MFARLIRFSFLLILLAVSIVDIHGNGEVINCLDVSEGEQEKQKWEFVERKLLIEPGDEARKVLPTFLGSLGAVSAFGIGGLLLRFVSGMETVAEANALPADTPYRIQRYMMATWNDSVRKPLSIVGVVALLIAPLSAYGVYKVSKHFLVDMPYRRALGNFLGCWASNKKCSPEKLHPLFDEIYEKYFDSEVNTLKWEYRISTELTFEVLNKVKTELAYFHKNLI